MKASELTERRKVNYRRVTRAGLDTGVGTVTQCYQDARGAWRAVLHDKANNRSVTVYPSQCTPWRRG